ncbi:hypothetical protein [Streptomyces sp. PR69]|uniref:hypothetical protein n=1 Tax=Streptomyces sp. PR69 TaxID=2984950 RepID=UPI00226476EC|nr:hypothetical protein [Streptomyces sp. PR69]
MNARRIVRAAAAGSALLTALAPAGHAAASSEAAPPASRSGEGAEQQFAEPQVLGGKGVLGRTLTRGVTEVGKALRSDGVE